MKRLFAILSIICAFVFAVACSSNATPTSTAKEYVKAIKSKDVAAIANLFYIADSGSEGAAEQRQMVEGIFKEKVLPGIEKNGGIESYTIGEETISEDGTSAVVEIEFVYGDGSSHIEEVELENVDGKWYIELGK